MQSIPIHKNGISNLKPNFSLLELLITILVLKLLTRF